MYQTWTWLSFLYWSYEPWPLHRAVVRQLDSDLVTEAGLPAPAGEPLAHWSPGVRTRISGLRPLGPS